MKLKKIFSVFTICLFVCSVLIAAGLRLGMTGAVKQKVKELDEKVLKKKIQDPTGGTTTPDTTRPTVLSTIPDNEAINIPLNRSITATFSEAMNPLTITGTTFTLKQGATPVSGTVTSVGSDTTFDPTSPLIAGLVYTATITNEVKDLAGNTLADNKVWTFTTSASGVVDNTAPTVNSTDPLDNATGIVLNKNISATFSEAMDPLTITTTTFTLKQGSTAVSGNVTYSGVTAVFTSTSNLTANTLYTATITNEVKDLAGKTLAVNKIWTFTTSISGVLDTTAPTVNSTDPLDNATGIVLNKNITATFSEAMNPATITGTTFTLKQGATTVPGTVTSVGSIATFDPTSPLTVNTLYTATITNGVKDLAGNLLSPYPSGNKIWTFTTGTSSDTAVPTVSYTDPVDNATGIVLNKNITATFTEAMNPLTITGTTFTLKKGTVTVSGTVTSVGSVATFAPTSSLTANTTYTATITNEVEDLAGNALADTTTWIFTTGTTLAAGPAPVNLGTTGNFVILAKAGISTTGDTHIYGNIGVSPISQTALTGFSETMHSSNEYSTSIYVSAPGAFAANTGKLYAADYTPPTPANMTTAISDMETAFTDAAGRAIPTATELYAGDISGRTLAPGLYKWSTGVYISDVGVTLSGGANDVWIFQIAQDLTVANGAIVTLSGGAQAKNIFWQVSGLTTLGTTSWMKGNMICQTLIDMQTGAKLTGRLLAQTAVTLDAATVTIP